MSRKAIAESDSKTTSAGITPAEILQNKQSCTALMIPYYDQRWLRISSPPTAIAPAVEVRMTLAPM
jgi:hypothetical protein